MKIRFKTVMKIQASILFIIHNSTKKFQGKSGSICDLSS